MLKTIVFACALGFACTSLAHQGHGSAQTASMPRAELGTGAAFAPDGTLWAVQKRSIERTPWPQSVAAGFATASGTRSMDQLVLRVSRDFGKTWSAPRDLLPAPEPISADGENRPKLAFGKNGLVVVSWTSPTSPRFTGDIRLLRSTDSGATWQAPQTVHADRQLITHRFESIAFDAHGRLFVAWIDRRDEARAKQQGREYDGAAIYYAVSSDGGASFAGDFKLADQSCECCRIALAFDPRANTMRAFWRHIFPPNERDFALAVLGTDGKTGMARATHDRWAIDACPHHGGALAIDADGTQHRTWFNVIQGEGRSFYARVEPGEAGSAVKPRALPAGALHADVLTFGRHVVVAWKSFDGTSTQLTAWASADGGKTFAEHKPASTRLANDQPRLVAFGDRVFVVWANPQSINVHEVPR